jgi:hypothetical protein
MTEMNQLPNAESFFSVTDLYTGTVITGLTQGDFWTLAKDEQSLSIPLLTALEFGVETIRMVLDESDITNCQGLSLSDWLSDDEADELRHLLSKITGPEPPNFTTPHGAPGGEVTR